MDNKDDSPLEMVQTERGLIKVTRSFTSEAEANAAGFYYAFLSKRTGRHYYSKRLDSRGLYHEFAVIER